MNMRALPARLLCLVAFIAVMSQFGGTLSKLVSVPNVLPLVRDGLLMVLALVAISRTNIFEAKAFFITVLLTLMLLAVNILIGAFENFHFAAVYYARLYLLPIIFAIAARGLLMSLSAEQMRSVVRTIFWLGLMVVAAAFVIFAAVEVNPSLLFKLMGSLEGQPLATAWYIAGGTWLRMGLPATSPNALGLILAFYLLLIVPLMVDGRFLRLGKFSFSLVVMVTALAMLMSFSRSSWLAVMFGGAVMAFVCRREWGLNSPSALLKLSALMLVGLILLIMALVAVDSYSGGFIGRWIDLNTSGTDPSMQGHGQSFVDAVAGLPDYFWIGYPKGTVSARALLFGGDVHNVENSIIGVFFEMGVPLGVVYLCLIAFMLRGLWLHKSQWGVVAAFGLCSMFLPYIFEPDMISLFLTVFTVLGRALQLSSEMEPEPAPVKAKRRPWRSTGGQSFQATIFEAR